MPQFDIDLSDGSSFTVELNRAPTAEELKALEPELLARAKVRVATPGLGAAAPGIEALLPGAVGTLPSLMQGTPPAPSLPTIPTGRPGGQLPAIPSALAPPAPPQETFAPAFPPPTPQQAPPPAGGPSARVQQVQRTLESLTPPESQPLTGQTPEEARRPLLEAPATEAPFELTSGLTPEDQAIRNARGKLGNLAQQGRLGLQESTAGLFNTLANIPMLGRQLSASIAKATGLPEGQVFSKSEEILRNVAKELAADPELLLDRNKSQGLDEVVARAAGQAIPALGQAIAAAYAGGPILGFSLLGALQEADKGLLASTLGALKNAGLGYFLRFTHGLPLTQRLPLVGGAFGGLTYAETQDVLQSLAQGLVGAGLALPGGVGGEALTQRIRHFWDVFRPESTVPLSGDPKVWGKDALLFGLQSYRRGATPEDVSAMLQQRFQVSPQVGQRTAENIRGLYEDWQAGRFRPAEPPAGAPAEPPTGPFLGLPVGATPPAGPTAPVAPVPTPPSLPAAPVAPAAPPSPQAAVPQGQPPLSPATQEAVLRQPESPLAPPTPATRRVLAWQSLIAEAAQRYGLDPALLAAVVEVESGGNPAAVSSAGAQGLGQLMPGTAGRYGVSNPFDPRQNLDGAAQYLRDLLAQFQGDTRLALAAYNAGEGNVQKYGGVPPFAETQRYVPAVEAAYRRYAPGGLGAAAPAATPGLAQYESAQAARRAQEEAQYTQEEALLQREQALLDTEQAQQGLGAFAPLTPEEYGQGAPTLQELATEQVPLAPAPEAQSPAQTPAAPPATLPVAPPANAATPQPSVQTIADNLLALVDDAASKGRIARVSQDVLLEQQQAFGLLQQQGVISIQPDPATPGVFLVQRQGDFTPVTPSTPGVALPPNRLGPPRPGQYVRFPGRNPGETLEGVVEAPNPAYGPSTRVSVRVIDAQGNDTGRVESIAADQAEVIPRGEPPAAPPITPSAPEVSTPTAPAPPQVEAPAVPTPPAPTVEVSFPRIPPPKVRTQLKNQGFKWNPERKVWEAPWNAVREDVARRAATNARAAGTVRVTGQPTADQPVETPTPPPLNEFEWRPVAPPTPPEAPQTPFVPTFRRGERVEFTRSDGTVDTGVVSADAGNDEVPIEVSRVRRPGGVPILEAVRIPVARVRRLEAPTAPEAPVTPTETPAPVSRDIASVAPTEPAAPLTDQELTYPLLDALFPLAGPVVDGRQVRADIPNRDSIDATFDVGKYIELEGVRAVPMQVFGLPPLPRASLDTRTAALASAIEASREINPLIVAIDPQGPYILEGGHRFDALRALNATAFPALIVVEPHAQPGIHLGDYGRSYIPAAPAAIETPTPVTPTEPSAPVSRDEASFVSLAQAIAARLSSNDPPKTLAQLQQIAEPIYGGSRAEGTFSPKDLYDAMELAVNLEIQRSGLKPEGTAEQAKAMLARLEAGMQRLPTQTVRTQEQIDYQQFSTPPTYAFVANWVAHVRPTDIVLEPSAGTGSLAVWAANTVQTLASITEGLVTDAQGLPQRMYHGTAAMFDVFDLAKKESASGQMFDGLFFAEDPSVAEYYAEEAVTDDSTVFKIKQTESYIEDVQRYLTKELAKGSAADPERLALFRQELASQHAALDALNMTPLAGTNIRPVYLRIRHPFDMTAIFSAEDIQRLLRMLKVRGWNVARIDEYLQQAFSTQHLSGRDLYDALIRAKPGGADRANMSTGSQILQALGYDGIFHQGREDGRVWVAFLPEQVLPAIEIDALLRQSGMVLTNELSPRRLEALRALGFEPTSDDALFLHSLFTHYGRQTPTVVVMNPPFSAAAPQGRGGGRNKEQTNRGGVAKRDALVGATHIEEALKLLQPGGRLVAIVGEGMSPQAATFRGWWKKIQGQYTVRANILIAKETYRKYGTAFGTRLLVIDKTGPQGSVKPLAPSAENVEAFTLEQALTLLEGIRNDRPIQSASHEPERPSLAPNGGGDPRPVSSTGTGAMGDGRGGTRSPASGGGQTQPVDRGDVGPGQRGGRGAPLPAESERPGNAVGGNAPARPGGTQPSGRSDRAPGTSSGPTVPAVGATSNTGLTTPQGVAPEETLTVLPQDERTPTADPTAQANLNATNDLSDNIFEVYSSAHIPIKGAQPHKTPLVQSAAMAAVPPAKITYTPNLPKALITSGALSAAQLEAPIYAGQAHAIVLPAPPELAKEGIETIRKGYFIGDGCVAAGTRIYNPLTHQHVPIEQLMAAGQPHTVLALTAKGLRPAIAHCPFLKGYAPLYRLVLEDGRTITVMDRHRFLTPQGWKTLAEGLQVGDSLACAENGQSADDAAGCCVPSESDENYSQTLPNFPGDYHLSVHSCGEQSLQALNIALDRLPCEVDVPAHTPTAWHGDVLAFLSEYTRHCLQYGRLARSDYAPSVIRGHAAISSPTGGDAFQLWVDSRPAHRQSGWSKDVDPVTSEAFQEEWESYWLDSALPSRLPCDAGEPDGVADRLPLWARLPHIAWPEPEAWRHPHKQQQSLEGHPLEADFLAFSCQYYSRWLKIRTVEYVGDGAFYDMHVPCHETYVAEGVINHNTGLGKGREIAAIILDNLRQGRKKAVWLSEKASLFDDAKRDWRAMGHSDKDVFLAGDYSPIKSQSGILFMTYDTLKESQSVPEDAKTPGQTRLAQVIQWLGKDFDGVIAFDEAHNMGNNTSTKGAMGTQDASKKALAGLALQRALPNARVVYVSATGATEVKNLGYAERLGLWGLQTDFANKNAFINEIAAGGVAVMELVARDMKALGLYQSRHLSYDGVEYRRVEHPLSPEQIGTYNTLAEAWQTVLQNIDAALIAAGGGNANGVVNKKVRRAGASIFWAANQRFFNQIVTTLAMPSVIRQMDADLANGHAVVIQLTNTNAAALDRKLASRSEEEELDDLVLNPIDTLIEYVKVSFPVTQLYDDVDANGTVTKKPLLDANGVPVPNAQAVAIRERLLDHLASLYTLTPDSPLDMIVNHFGPERVAEITGRPQRMVWTMDENGQRVRQIEQRREPRRRAEADSFMRGERDILVFSEKGGTGRSYHADLDSGNQKHRMHYLVQAGWRADKAMQGLGRTHRTNQASAPTYVLVTTDLPGHKRFVSSIARRLGQLGALVQGQRQTTTQGLFSERDNLESPLAQQALDQFIREIATGQTVTEGIPLDEFQRQTAIGLVNEQGQVLKTSVKMTNFLNRLLAMNVDMQHATFEAFSRRMDAHIERAIQDGTLDAGLETLRAARIELVNDRPIATHEASGAETRLVTLKLFHKREPMTWEQLQARHQDASNARNPFGRIEAYGRNVRSGRAYAFLTAPSRTDERGAVIPQVKRVSPGGAELIDRAEIRQGGYKELTAQEAEPLWREQLQALPPFREQTQHLLTGILLPHWAKLRSTSPRVYRVQTQDGQRFLGRTVTPGELPNILRNFGLSVEGETTAPQLTPTQAIENVLKGATLTLDNGWTIVRRVVGGQPNVEIKGPNYNEGQVLVGQGAFYERIQNQGRYFIPRGANGPVVMQRLLESRQIVDMALPAELARQDAIDGMSMRAAQGDTRASDIVDMMHRPTAELAAQASAGQIPPDFPPYIQSRTAITARLQRLHEAMGSIPGARPFATGYLGRGRLGEFHVRAEVIRTRLANDIETLAHEVGHHLLKFLYGDTQAMLRQTPAGPRLGGPDPVSSLLQQYRPELAALASPGGSPLREGFAEFVRLYLTAPETALSHAPTFFPVFERFVQDTDSAIAAELLGIQQEYTTWTKLPLSFRMEGLFDRRAGRWTLPTWHGVEEWFHWLYGQTFNTYHPLSRLVAEASRQLGHQPQSFGSKLLFGTRETTPLISAEADPSILAATLRGVAGKGDAFVQQGVLDFASGDFVPGSKGLKQVLAPLVERTRFGTRDLSKLWEHYMVGRRALELADRANNPDASPRAIANAERASTLLMRVQLGGVTRTQLEEYVQALAAQFLQFPQVHDDYQTWNQGLLAYLRDSGALTADAYDSIVSMNQSHIPWQRIMDEGTWLKQVAGTGKTIANVPEAIKTIKGSLRDFMPPIEAAIRQAYHITRIAERQAVGRATIELIERMEGGGLFAVRVPPAMQHMQGSIGELKTQLEKAGVDVPDEALDELLHIWRPDTWRLGANQVRIVRNGRSEHWEVRNPELYRAVLDLDRTTIQTFFRFLSVPMALVTQLKRFAITASPTFWIKNIFRDQETLLAQTSQMPFRGFIENLWQAIGQGDRFQEWAANGGLLASFARLSYPELRKQRDQYLLGKYPTDIPHAVKILTHPWQIIPLVYELSRDALAVSEDATRLGVYQRQMEHPFEVDTSGRAQKLRAAYASRDGVLDFGRVGAAIQGLRLVTFALGPGLGGLDKLARTVLNYPRRTAAILATLMMGSLLLRYFLEDDTPQYWNPATQIFESRRTIYYRLSQTVRDLNHVIITKRADNTARIWLIPFKAFDWGFLGHTLFERAVLDPYFKRASDAGADPWRAIGTAAARAIGANVIPDVFQLGLELNYNWSSFRDRPIEGQHLQGMEPAYRYDSSTSEIARQLGGLLGLSPKKIDHTLRLGYLATEGLYLGDALLRTLQGKAAVAPAARRWEETPGLQAFFGRYPSLDAEPIQQYRLLTESIDQRINAVKHLASQNDPRYSSVVSDPQTLGYLTLQTFAHELNRRLSEQTKKLQAVRLDPAKTPIEKRNEQDQIMLGMINGTEKFVEIAQAWMQASLKDRTLASETLAKRLQTLTPLPTGTIGR